MRTADIGEAIIDVLKDAANSIAEDIDLNEQAEAACKAWCEENLEDRVDDEAERAINRLVENIDLSDAIEEATKNYDFDLDRKIETAIEEAYIDEQAASAVASLLTGGDFDANLDRIVANRVDNALRDPAFIAKLALAIKGPSLMNRVRALYGRIVAKLKKTRLPKLSISALGAAFKLRKGKR